MEQKNMSDFTVKEIADILKVSKTTVQKAIKAANISYDYIERNRQYYSMEKTRQIVLSIRADFDFSLLESQLANSPTETENSQTDTANQVDNSPTQTEKPKTETANSPTDSKEELAALHRLIDLVQQQLAEKDKQLAVKDKQIQDLSDRLAEAMQLTHGQQYIAAADRVMQLKESQQPEEETIIVSSPAPAGTEQKVENPLAADNPPQKKSLWARLFGK